MNGQLQPRRSYALYPFLASRKRNHETPGRTIPQKVMYDAYWKTPSMAWRYIKLLQVVFPFKDFGVEMDAISPEDYGTLYSTPLTQQGKWFQAFASNADLFDQSELDLMQTEA